MVVIDGKEYDIVMVDEVAYTSIFDFLEDKEEYREAFLKRHSDDFKSMKDLEKDLKEGGDRILEVIEGDTDEIAEIMDMLAKDDEFYIVDYMEREDVIVAGKYKIIPRNNRKRI